MSVRYWKDWRNVVPCTCSVTISQKHGAVFDKSHCPRHGKAAKPVRRVEER